MPDPLAPFDPIIQAAAEEWNVDPLLLRALAMQENGKGDPKAVSKAGAQGLMQIMPDTAKGLGVTDPFDPVQSIYAGAKYLSEGLDKEGSPEGALLYYHGGPGWRRAYGPESAAYVPGVAGHYKRLLQAQPPAPAPAAAPATAPPRPRRRPLMADDYLDAGRDVVKGKTPFVEPRAPDPYLDEGRAAVSGDSPPADEHGIPAAGLVMDRHGAEHRRRRAEDRSECYQSAV